MDGIQRGYFFFSQKWCTVELLHNGHLGGQKKAAVVERFKQESMYGLFTKKVTIV